MAPELGAVLAPVVLALAVGLAPAVEAAPAVDLVAALALGLAAWGRELARLRSARRGRTTRRS